MLFFVALFPTPALASGAISQGFATADTNVSQGALLSLVASGQNLVALANNTNTSKLVGIASSQPLIELSASSKNNIPVVVSGSTDALVSDINGTISIGDKITASPINGIGMKADSSGEVVGTAQEDLNLVRTVNQTVTKANGSTSSVRVGLLPIEVNVTYYSIAPIEQGTLATFLPPALQNLANYISNRQVSPFKVLVGALVLILGFITSAIMLYSSIRANIASLGRNPLAQHILRKGFIDVVIAALGVLAITVIATYAILIA